MKPIILKIGGSIITHKERGLPQVNLPNVRKIVNQLVGLNKKFILIHGAGSFGHPIVKRTGIHKGIRKKKDLVSFAETQRLQNKLNCLITKELIKKDLPAFPCQASSQAVMSEGRLIKMDLDAIRGLLKLGLIPVLYGVPAYDVQRGCSILSGDQIASFLAKNLKIKKIIMASDTDGIFSADPKKDKNAQHIKRINRANFKKVKKMLTGSSSVDVTGGMAGKVLEIIEIAKRGVSTQIIDGIKRNNIKKAFLGQKVGTIIEW